MYLFASIEDSNASFRNHSFIYSHYGACPNIFRFLCILHLRVMIDDQTVVAVIRTVVTIRTVCCGRMGGGQFLRNRQPLGVTGSIHVRADILDVRIDHGRIEELLQRRRATAARFRPEAMLLLLCGLMLLLLLMLLLGQLLWVWLMFGWGRRWRRGLLSTCDGVMFHYCDEMNHIFLCNEFTIVGATVAGMFEHWL